MTRSRSSVLGTQLAVLAGLAAVILAILAAGGPSYQVTAVFQQAYGIVDGSRVWAGGGIVGSVARIRLGADGLPHVTLTVDGDFRLRSTATADLQLLSNSGELNRIIVLHKGTGPNLPDGAVIPASRTSEPVEVDDVLGTFSPTVRTEADAVLAQLDGSTRGLANAFEQTLAHSAAALGQTAQLLNQVNNDGYALKNLVSQGSIAMHAFAVQQQPLDRSVDTVARLLHTVAGRQTQLRSAITLLPAGLQAPTEALRAVQRAIPTLAALTHATAPVATRAGSTSRLLARTLVLARPTAAELASVLRAAPQRLRVVLPLLRAVPPTADVLTPVLQKLLPMLDLLRVYTPELLGYLADWGDLTNMFDAAGHGLAAAFTVASPANQTVPPSSNASGYLAAPYQRDPGALIGQAWTDYRGSFLSKTPGTRTGGTR